MMLNKETPKEANSAPRDPKTPTPPKDAPIYRDYASI